MIKIFHSIVFLFCSSLSTVSSAAMVDKTIGILVYDDVLTSDVTAPLEVFGVASRKSWFSDYQVITIGIKDKPTIKTEEGLLIGVDTWIGDSEIIQQLDVLLVPSRYEMDSLLSDQALITFIKTAAPTTEWITSNCSGAFLLAEAGVLQGKKATTWAGGEADLKKQYPEVNVQFDTNVVIDGNVITSNGSLVSYQAALVLLRKMSSKRRAQEVAEAIQYARFSDKEY